MYKKPFLNREFIRDNFLTEFSNNRNFASLFGKTAMGKLSWLWVKLVREKKLLSAGDLFNEGQCWYYTYS